LVDADVAKPHISQLFGVQNQPGLTDLLKDKNAHVDKFVIRTDMDGLKILPAGRPDEGATELLASRRMEKVINELSESYSDRIVIFDSPPLLVTSESRVLASLMGQIAMIVCAGKTPQGAVLEAIDYLDQTKPINLILNQSMGGEGSGAYGHYGYGYGRHNHSNGNDE
jgi:Mrp family chromosome partitioning ATPase